MLNEFGVFLESLIQERRMLNDSERIMQFDVIVPYKSCLRKRLVNIVSAEVSYGKLQGDFITSGVSSGNEGCSEVSIEACRGNLTE